VMVMEMVAVVVVVMVWLVLVGCDCHTEDCYGTMLMVANKCQLECYMPSETQSLYTIYSAQTSSLLWDTTRQQLRFMVLECVCAHVEHSLIFSVMRIIDLDIHCPR
jgi:hypothetical protein